jgi:dTMP kinase
MRPPFISIEGIDGAGKSTHLAAIGAQLKAHGTEVLQTREPGGTPLAEALRGLLLQASEPADLADPLSEALMVFAARRDHVLRTIRPALAKGWAVVSDRFTDSSFAYQGAGSGVPWPVLQQLEAWACEGLEPDLTLWFDLEPAEAARRRASARQADRFEAQDLTFFEKVRAGYARRAAESPQRFVRIDASQALEDVALAVRQTLRERTQ